MKKSAPTSNEQVEISHQKEHEQIQPTREETRYMAPPVDIFETDAGLIQLADLPGVDKSKVDVRVDEGILTIEGEAAYDKPENLLYNAFDIVKFYRQFELSDETDQARITAKINNGVLTLHLPKAEKAKPRRIDVKVQSCPKLPWKK